MTLRFLAVATAFLFPLQTVDITTVLNNATAYVERYEPTLGLIIAEEEYDQRAPLTDLAFRAEGVRSGGVAPRGGVVAEVFHSGLVRSITSNGRSLTFSCCDYLRPTISGLVFA